MIDLDDGTFLWQRHYCKYFKLWLKYKRQCQRDNKLETGDKNGVEIMNRAPRLILPEDSKLSLWQILDSSRSLNRYEKIV